MAIGTGCDSAVANGDFSNQRIAPTTCSDTQLRFVLQNEDQGWSERQSVCTPIVTLCGLVLGTSCRVHKPGRYRVRECKQDRLSRRIRWRSILMANSDSGRHALVLTIPCMVQPFGLVQGFLNHKKSCHRDEYAIRVRLPA